VHERLERIEQGLNEFELIFECEGEPLDGERWRTLAGLGEGDCAEPELPSGCGGGMTS
jgi:hypothetical protein